MLQLMNAKLVLLNFLLLLLLLLIISGSLSDVYSLEDGNNAASNGKTMLGDLHFQRASKRFGLGGRKMGFDSLMVLEKLKGHGPCERPSKMASPSRRKQIMRSLISKSKEKDHYHHQVAELVAFSADYKGPRYHPPKNN